MKGTPLDKKILATLASFGILASSLGGTPAQAKGTGDISGFFIAATNADKTNKSLLTDIKKAGGDTVVTFGYTLEKSNYTATKTGLFNDCTVGSSKCVDVARKGVSVRNYLVYKGNTKFTSKVRNCSRDVFTTNKSGRSYAFFAIPVSGTCSKPSKVDIVATTSYGLVKEDNITVNAQKLGMKHYIGMPSPSKDTKSPWLPNTSYLSTMSVFTKMFAQSNNTGSGLAGFYQHREMPMSTHSSWNGMRSLFSTQNKAIAGSSVPYGVKNVLISPYMDARKKMNQTPAQARDAIKKLADTKNGLRNLTIAPQDGMGTGKGSAYTGTKWKGKVDPFARTVVGNVYHSQAYFANTATYYSYMKKGLSGKKGVSLWANIESMAPLIKSGANKNVCSTSHHSERGFTWKSRLSAQIAATKSTTSKRISYHWDYLNCSRNGATPMKNELPSMR